MKCHKFERWLSDRIDHELSEGKERTLKLHLRECHRCRDYLSQLESLHIEPQRFQSSAVRPRYMHDLSARLRSRLIAEKQMGQRLKSSPLQWRWGREFSKSWAYVMGSVAAAALIVFFLFGLPKRASFEKESFFFSLGDVLAQVDYETGNNPELESEYNTIILDSLEVELTGAVHLQELDLLWDSLIWENLTDEELRLIEIEIKKEMRS